MKISKINTPINCRIFDGDKHTPVLCEAYKLDQIYMGGHEFYVTKLPDWALFQGWTLTEFSTGTAISGATSVFGSSLPEKSKNKAAAWFLRRYEEVGSCKLVKMAQSTLENYGRYNGTEKAFSVDGKTVNYSDMQSETEDSTELFDLNTIPVDSTYYLRNGATVKRII